MSLLMLLFHSNGFTVKDLQYCTLNIIYAANKKKSMFSISVRFFHPHTHTYIQSLTHALQKRGQQSASDAAPSLTHDSTETNSLRASSVMKLEQNKQFVHLGKTS